MSDDNSIALQALRVHQPLGEFFIGVIDAVDLRRITYSDVRERIPGEDEMDSYLGIQRRLSPKRVKELQGYVESPDACFPTAVILAVDSKCAAYDEKNASLELSAYHDDESSENDIDFAHIAKVLDGQHRIEGLRKFQNRGFQINVSIFIDMDLADQAYLFSTVNLAQTKVNRSLVYDLFGLANSRSPQRTCHEAAVALDRVEDSPLRHRIKRLGIATPGRDQETITQATFVESLMGLITNDPAEDRKTYLRRKKPGRATDRELRRHPFRNMFIDELDLEITDTIWNFFSAVSRRWPESWNANEKGQILNRTNGFRALMRLLRDLYPLLEKRVPSEAEFLAELRRSDLLDGSFTTDKYQPGTSGESSLYHDLRDSLNIR